MIQPDDIHTDRTDITCNMARFRTLKLEPEFFGGEAFVRRWGRKNLLTDLHAGRVQL